MTIASSNSRNNYVGNGLLDTYQYTFLIRNAEDLRVTLKDPDLVEYPQTLGVDYTVDGVGESEGGTITLEAGNLTSGWTISIRRVKAVNQETDLRNQGSYFPETVEDALDDLAMSDQQQQDEIDRSMKLPETIDPDSFDPILPPELIGSPNRAFGTDPTGTKFALGPSFGDIQGAAASAAAAAASEANAADSAADADAARIAAEAARDAAQLAESGAVAAEGNAASSESNAQIYAGQANTSAINAADSASDASGYASTATTAAGDAESARDAALGAQSAAESARDDAEAAADAAEAAVNGFLVVADTDDASTGAIVALSTTVPDKGSIRLTGAATSLDGLGGGSGGRIVYVINASGSDIPVRHLNSGASAANRINTGSGGDNLTLKNGGIFQFKYDGTSNVWRVSGGAGGASLSTALTGLASTGNTIADTDSILVAFRKLNNRANAIPENVIANGVAAVDAAGYSAYADAAGAKPVDGTGGSPTLSIGVNSTDPLDGSQQFIITKDAANRQGEGIGYPFTIKHAQKYKINRISFDYAGSAAFAYKGGNFSSPSDISVWIYDVTNGVLIEPSQSYLDGSGELISEFQASGSTDYRVILHVSTTNASAWTFLFTNLKVGRRQVARGPAMSDWISFTGSGSWVSNTTYDARYRRDGDTMEVFYRVATSGAPTSSILSLNLPSGFSVDTSKITQTANPGQCLGSYNILDFGTQYYVGSVAYNNTTSVLLQYNNGTQVSQTTPMTWASGDILTAQFRVPILGWSSNMIVSSDFGSRVIGSKAAGTPTGGTNGTSSLVWPTLHFDYTSSYNTSNGAFTAPETGLYVFMASVGWTASPTAGQFLTLYAYKNGVSLGSPYGTIHRAAAGQTGNDAQTMGLVQMNAGDVLTFRVDTNLGTFAFNSQGSWINVAKWQSPQTLLGGELIEFEGVNTAGTSLGSLTDLPFTSVIDSHGAWNGTEFTVPRSGKYRIESKFQTSGVSLSTTQRALILVQKNGSDLAYGTRANGNGVSTFHSPSIAVTKRFAAGDKIKIQGSSDVATSLSTGVGGCFLSITSVQ